MKTSLLLTCIVSVLLWTSCGSGGFEADAKKLARYECEISKLGDKEDEARQELLKKAKALGKKMEEKYGKGNDELKEKYSSIRAAIMEKCEESPAK
jgi:hypothetical protein